MTFPEFDTFSEKLLNQVVNMKNSKGKEYANSEDRFANFDRLAERLELKNTQIGWVYLTKHLDAIESYIKCGFSHSTETIQGRIVDAICYLTLIAGMIQEQEDFQGETEQGEELKDTKFEHPKIPYICVNCLAARHRSCMGDVCNCEYCHPLQPRAENKILWSCHYCEYKTPNKSDLEAHEMWHDRSDRTKT